MEREFADVLCNISFSLTYFDIIMSRMFFALSFAVNGRLATVLASVPFDGNFDHHYQSHCIIMLVFST